MKEEDLARAVVNWLKLQYDDVYQEVRLWGDHGRIADIVVKVPTEHGPLHWVIECKTSLSIALLDQATDWTQWADFVSIAVPQRKEKMFGREYRTSPPRVVSRVLSDLGIGMLELNTLDEYSDERSRVRVVQEPRLHRTKWKQTRDLWATSLRDECRDMKPAGTTGGGYWTPYRSTCDGLARYVQEHPGCTLKQAVLGLKEHHYASCKTAISSLSHWLRLGKVHGVEFVQDGRTRLLYPARGPRKLRGAEMSTTACVTCIGPYRDKLLEQDCYDYPKEFYDPKGTKSCMVVVDVLQCETLSRSEVLASALGVPLRNCCRHEVLDSKINWKTLNEEFGAEAFRFGRLLEAGYLAFFRPEC